MKVRLCFCNVYKTTYKHRLGLVANVNLSMQNPLAKFVPSRIKIENQFFPDFSNYLNYSGCF